MCTVKCARPSQESMKKYQITPGKEYTLERIFWGNFGNTGYAYWFEIKETGMCYHSSLFVLTQEVNNLIAYSYTPLYSSVRLN